MAEVEDYFKEMTGGSMIYGMLCNDLDPEQMFFKDSSPYDSIDSPRKLKKLKLPIPEKIRLSIKPKLEKQVEDYRRKFRKKGRTRSLIINYKG